jgi:hypothetical protein
MAETIEKESAARDYPNHSDVKREASETGPTEVGSVATIPKGTIDPVYEAKARVLNHAVRLSFFPAQH